MESAKGSAESKSSHDYDPLPGADYLRILVLQPAQKVTAPIRCSMDTLVVNDTSDYTALSYSWGMHGDGDDALNRRITIDGRPMLVTQNLFEGLRRLRSITESRRLWVDAVCIHQKDPQERSAQVARMAEIFRHASHVAVWLGENSDEAGEDLVQNAILNCFGDDEYDHPVGTHTWLDKASEMQVDMCAIRKNTAMRKLKLGRRLTGDSVFSSLSSPATLSLDDGVQSTENLEPVVRALDSLFNRRYFKRRWILQELYHSPASNVQLYFGSCEISLDTFAAVCGGSIRDSRSLRRFIVGSRRERSQEWKGVQFGLREVERVIRLAKDKEKTTFLEALERSSHLHCSDPRDVLYSLASLDPDFGIVPDYNLTTAEVYTKFAGMLVERGMWDVVLDNICSHTPVVDEVPQGLPSWVPDFQQGFVRSGYIEGLEMVDAEAPTTGTNDTSEATVIEKTVLQCSFFAIGVVNFGKPWPYGDGEEPSEDSNTFDKWRSRLMTTLSLTELSDVFELDGAKPYDAVSMGDIVCSPRKVYTTEEAVIVVLTPADANAENFKIVQVHRGIDLRSLNGQNISELLHHSTLPAGSQFRVSIV